MDMRKVVVPLAIIALSLGAWFITQDPEHGAVQVRSATAPVEAAPESGSTPATADVPALSDQPAPSDPVEPPVQVALTPMEQKARSAQFLADPGLAGIEQAFAAERVDPLWATGMEGHILGQLAQANLQLVTMQVECRTSMCRIQLVEPPSKRTDPGTFHDLVRELGLDVWRVNGFVDQSGTPTLVAHLARRESMSPAQTQALIRELERTLPPQQREVIMRVVQGGDPEANTEQ
jgi:guanyl-specific ribonuclease Sa